jgi:uncharacterized membrane protein
VDLVPAHLAIAVAIVQRQVTVIMVVHLRFPLRVIVSEHGSFWLAVTGFSANAPSLFTQVAILYRLRRAVHYNPLPVVLTSCEVK